MIIKSIASVLFFFAVLEIGLIVADPYGFHYAVDGARMRTESRVIDGLRVYNPGVYDYRGFSVTIQADYTRRVPDTRASTCQIVMLGDSITLGHGVDDHETFTNLLAQQFPDVEFMNTGFSGYNSHEVLQVYQRTPADGYLYLIVANDTYPELPPQHFAHKWYVPNYAASIAGKVPSFPDEFERFYADLDTLAQDSSVHLASYGALEMLAGYEVLVIEPPQPKDTLSVMDGHPNAAGHRMIADQLAPYVERLINKVCHEQR